MKVWEYVDDTLLDQWRTWSETHPSIADSKSDACPKVAGLTARAGWLGKSAQSAKFLQRLPQIHVGIISSNQRNQRFNPSRPSREAIYPLARASVLNCHAGLLFDNQLLR